MSRPVPKETARYLLSCAEASMADVRRSDLPAILAARAQAEAMLAIAEAIDAAIDTINALLVPKPAPPQSPQ